MILLLVGATESARAVVRDASKILSVEIRVGTSRERPDWVMTATRAERAEAMRRHALPSHRVIELPDLGTDGMIRLEVVQVALARMSEIGPRPRPRPRPVGAIATCALPLLREWSTWLAADEARHTIAAHLSFLRSKDDSTNKGRMLFLVPDAPAVSVLRGLLNRLSRERYQVHVAITHTPGDTNLTALEGEHWGLSVGCAPALHDSPGQPLATALRDRLDAWRARSQGAGGMRPSAERAVAWAERRLPLELDVIGFLEDRKPQVVIVAPHRSAHSAEPDYFRAARCLGLRSVCLPLRWDDLETSGALRHDLPDAFAVWNEEQRREVVTHFGYSADRVHVTGALLLSDVVEGHPHLERDAYCARMGIDPTRRIILMGAPAVSSRASIARFHEWRQAVKSCADPNVSRAAVVVYVQNPEEVAIWRRLAPAADISVARAGTDQERAPFRLVESLTTADVVVATDLALALEAVAHEKPVIALLEAEGGDAEELARFSRVYASTHRQPAVTRSVQDAVARLSMALAPDTTAHHRHPAAAIVRANGEDSGAERVYRLLDDLARRDPPGDAPARPPTWQRLLMLLCTAVARRRVANSQHLQ